MPPVWKPDAKQGWRPLNVWDTIHLAEVIPAPPTSWVAHPFSLWHLGAPMECVCRWRDPLGMWQGSVHDKRPQPRFRHASTEVYIRGEGDLTKWFRALSVLTENLDLVPEATSCLLLAYMFQLQGILIVSLGVLHAHGVNKFMQKNMGIKYIAKC